MSVINTLFNRNKTRINKNIEEIKRVEEKSEVSSFTYGFVNSTLAEALLFPTTEFKVLFISNARKGGELAGLGTGLPAFWDVNGSTPQWVDFTGTVITV